MLEDDMLGWQIFAYFVSDLDQVVQNEPDADSYTLYMTKEFRKMQVIRTSEVKLGQNSMVYFFKICYCFD